MIENIAIDFNDVGGSVGGALLSLVLVILGSLIAVGIRKYWIRPVLRAYMPEDEPKSQPVGRTVRNFYHVGLVNEGRSSIRNARIILEYHGKNVFKKFLAKWDFKAEPYTTYGRAPGGPSPALIVDSQIHDLVPKFEETFCHGLRYDGQIELWPFSPFNYLFPDLKNPMYGHLGLGEFNVIATVIGENYQGQFAFEIVNKGMSKSDIIINPRSCKPTKGLKRIEWKM